jgi:hypothetical protein
MCVKWTSGDTKNKGGWIVQIDLSDCVGEDVPEGWHEVEILSVEPEPTNPGAVIIAMETADGRIAKNWVYHDKIAGRNFLKSFWLACGFQGSSMDTRLLVQCRARVFLEKYQSRKSGCWYSRAVKVEMPASPVKAAIPVVEAPKAEPEDESVYGIWIELSGQWESLGPVEGRIIPELRRWLIKANAYDLPF